MYLHVQGALADNQVTCTVESTAKVAEYAAVQIAVNYFNDARSLMRSDIIPANKSIAPGSRVTITETVSPPEGYETVSFAIRTSVQN